MARRLMVILMSAMIMIGFVSCDLADAVKFMSNNIAGPNPGKISEVTSKLDESEISSESVTGFRIGNKIDITNFDNTDLSKGVESVLSPMGLEKLEELAGSIVSASRTDASKKALNDSLKEPITDEEVKTSTSGSAQVILNLVNALSDSESSAGEYANIYNKFVDGLTAIATQKTASGDYNITKGDVAILQVAYTVIDELVGNYLDENLDPIISEGEEGFKEQAFEMLQTANIALNVVLAVAPSSSFSSMELDSLLNDFMDMMNNKGAKE